MIVRTTSIEAFECYEKACAPPPVGRGGSSKSKRRKPANRSLTMEEKLANRAKQKAAYQDNEKLIRNRSGNIAVGRLAKIKYGL